MTTEQQAFDAKVEHKIKAMMPYIVKVAGGDPDLIQEGAIGVWESMLNEPAGSTKDFNQYYRNKAKWNILNHANGVGKSVDIPKVYKRKWPISIVHYDAGHSEDPELNQAMLADRRRVPLDEWVIQKIDFRGFLDSLTTMEYGYLHLKMVEGLIDKDASKRMDVSVDRVQEIKKAIRAKVEDFFNL